MTVKIGGREIPMLLSTYETIAIQEEIGCTVAQIRDDVFGLTQDLETGEWHFGIVKDPKMQKKFGTLIRILGNAGLEENGQEPDLTDKWVLRNMKPAMVLPYVLTVTAIINDAMKMESTEEKTGPVDVILEEENRKKEQGN